MQVGKANALAVRENLLREASQVGYTCITDAEYCNFGASYNGSNTTPSTSKTARYR